MRSSLSGLAQHLSVHRVEKGRTIALVGRPALKREAVAYMVGCHRISQRRACRLVGLNRSVHYYRSCKDPKLALRARMHEIAQVRIRYGYRRIHVLLCREGWRHGRNQTYRLYTEE